ncbi:hypothetical protein ACRAVF_00870 [Bradyrhizobium oligotrophicum S58]
MPIAYFLALAAIAGALSVGIPLEAVMLKISDGVSKVAMLPCSDRQHTSVGRPPPPPTIQLSAGGLRSSPPQQGV